MTKHFRVLSLAGDGVGPEIMEEALRIIEATSPDLGIYIEIEEDLIHGQCWERYGTFCQDETVAKAKKSDAVLVGAVGGERWDSLLPDGTPDEKDGLMRLRMELDVYAGLRPTWATDCLLESTAFRPESIRGTDIIVLRELCGGTFFGEPRGIEKLEGNNQLGIDTTLYTSEEIERHARIGFELASRRKMKLVSADKANVMESGVLWRKVITEIGREFPDVELQHLYTDNCAYQLASNPRQFDVIVTDNLFGDILSDLAGALAGSLGMLPSASLNGLTVNAETRKPGIFEPVHGTAPDLAGQGTVNPLAMILTVGMMYEYGFDLPGSSQRLRRSVETALKQGIRTRDLGGEASTREMTDAVIEAWRQ